MLKENILGCIIKNPTWDAEVLLEQLGITWDELIILLKDLSGTLEWSLHNYFAHYYLPNGAIHHTLLNREFTFSGIITLEELEGPKSK